MLRPASAKWRGHPVLRRCFMAGTEILPIVQVQTVSKGFKPGALQFLLQHAEELVLAMEAAIRPVHRILLSLQLVGFDRSQRNAVLQGKVPRVAELRPGQAGGVGDDRQHLRPEYLMGRVSQVGGIHPTGIRDDDAIKRSQARVQGLFLIVEHFLVHVPDFVPVVHYSVHSDDAGGRGPRSKMIDWGLVDLEAWTFFPK